MSRITPIPGRRVCGDADRTDFAQHYRASARPLELWARLHLRSPVTERMPVEDFLQEVWARAYTARGSFDAGKASFRSWLFGIAYNVLREQLRALHSRRRVLPGALRSGESVSRVFDDATTVRTRAAGRENEEMLRGAIARLDDQERRLVAWRGLEELSYGEIAARIGITPSAAESRWRRALVRLRGMLPAELFAEVLGDARG